MDDDRITKSDTLSHLDQDWTFTVLCRMMNQSTLPGEEMSEEECCNAI